MLTQFVHPRLGLPNFLKFQPYFLSALEAFDQGLDTKIEIAGLAPTTVAARLRDSLMGYRANRDAWLATGSINPRLDELFVKHDGKFTISGPDSTGTILFRAKRPVGKQVTALALGSHERYARIDKVQVMQPANTGPQYHRAQSCDSKVVLSYGHLRGIGELHLPIIFPGLIEPSIIDTLTTSFDLAFHYDDQRHETIMM